MEFQEFARWGFNTEKTLTETIINGVTIRYQIYDNSGYILENDEISFGIISDSLKGGFVAGELSDSNADTEWDGQGWWAILD